jgi:hypothetical protein
VFDIFFMAHISSFTLVVLAASKKKFVVILFDIFFNATVGYRFNLGRRYTKIV